MEHLNSDDKIQIDNDFLSIMVRKPRSRRQVVKMGTISNIVSALR